MVSGHDIPMTQRNSERLLFPHRLAQDQASQDSSIDGRGGGSYWQLMAAGGGSRFPSGSWPLAGLRPPVDGIKSAPTIISGLKKSVKFRGDMGGSWERWRGRWGLK